MTVYKARFFLIYGTVLSGGMTIIIFFAWLRWLQHQNWAMIVLGVIALLTSSAACLHYLRSLKFPKPLAVFSALGITNEEGAFLAWSDVTKAYRWTGVLFVKDSSRSDWFLRIEPFDVGGEQFRRAVRFVLDHAPKAATENLKLP